MAKRIFSLLVILAIIFVLPASTPVKSVVPVAPAIEVPVDEPSVNGILKARFENMLNHNYIYGDDFSSDLIMIENSILALLDKSEDGQIDKGLVLGFIAGMYGRQVDPAVAVYDFLPADDDKFAILARGYDAYNHKIIAVEEIDGGYKVISDVTVYPCDGFEYLATCESIFVPNEGSSFSYNLISSVISDCESSMV